MRAAAIAIAVGAVLATSATASAQAPQVFRTDGGAFDRASAIATDRDGNSYVAGSVESTAGADPFAVVKLASDGTRRFIARYDGSLGGFLGNARAVAVDAAGNVYAAGYILDDRSSDPDYLVVKFSPDGSQRWARRYNGTLFGTDIATAVVVDGGGNVYVTGLSERQGSDWATLKFASDGALQWERRVSGAASTSNDRPADMALLPDGNVAVTGVTQNTGGELTNDAETLVYDAQGAIVWRARFTDAAGSHEQVFDIDVDAAGRVAIAATTALDASPDGPARPVTLRYDSRGGLLQTIRAGGSSVDADPAGNVYVAGFFPDPSSSSVAKYDAAGNRLWTTPLTAATGEVLMRPRVAADSTGAVTVAGTARDLGSVAEDNDYLTFRFAADGRELSRHRFDGEQPNGDGDEVAGLVIAADDSALVTGTSFAGFAGASLAPATDIVTLRFAAGAVPALVAPSQLAARALSRSQIELRWQDNGGSVDGFRVERCARRECTNFTQVAEVGRTVTSYLDGGLSRSTAYSYRVRAFNAGGVSGFSNTATATTSK